MSKKLDKDARELARQARGSKAESLVFDRGTFLHATVVPPSVMEQTVVNGNSVILIKPLSKLNEETIKNNPSLSQRAKKRKRNDVFGVKSLPHSISFIQKHDIKRKPGGKFYVHELEVLAEHHKPVGPTTGTKWKTPGQDGVYECQTDCRIIRTYFIKLGRNGNVSDPDSVIMLVKDNVWKSMKVGMKDPSIRYNDGNFIMDDDSDDESTGIVKHFHMKSSVATESGGNDEEAGDNDDNSVPIEEEGGEEMSNDDELSLWTHIQNGGYYAGPGQVRIDFRSLKTVADNRRVLKEALHDALEKWKKDFGTIRVVRITNVNEGMKKDLESIGYERGTEDDEEFYERSIHVEV